MYIYILAPHYADERSTDAARICLYEPESALKIVRAN